MKIGIIGSAVVGQTLAAKLLQLGHDVVIGTRDPSNLNEAKGMGGTLGDWLRANPGGRVVTNEQAATHGELIINATNGEGALNALTLAGAENLGGKVLIDVSNPLDFSKGMPPTLTVKDTDSLGEQIQRAFPTTKVVKTLNTMNCFVMVDPTSVPGDSTVFVSGNDAAAKATVSALLTAFGWTDIFDLGDLSTARGTEMMMPMWIRMFMTLGSVPYNYKIVR
jgi:8-hydroxy-5-deazaflavin:NADPH oxidoreductase